MFHMLELSDQQRQSMRSIMETAGPDMKSLHQQMRANAEKLHRITPDDKNYASVLAQVSGDNGKLTTQMIAKKADLRAKLYAVLTPEQKTKLAAMKAKWREHEHEPMHHGPRGDGKSGDMPPPAP